MRSYGLGKGWDRALYAPRTDAPLMATAIISRGMVTVILPPAKGSMEDVNRLLQFLGQRVSDPFGKSEPRRKK